MTDTITSDQGTTYEILRNWNIRKKTWKEQFQLNSTKEANRIDEYLKTLKIDIDYQNWDNYYYWCKSLVVGSWIKKEIAIDDFKRLLKRYVYGLNGKCEDMLKESKNELLRYF